MKNIPYQPTITAILASPPPGKFSTGILVIQGPKDNVKLNVTILNKKLLFYGNFSFPSHGPFDPYPSKNSNIFTGFFAPGKSKMRLYSLRSFLRLHPPTPLSHTHSGVISSKSLRGSKFRVIFPNPVKNDKRAIWHHKGMDILKKTGPFPWILKLCRLIIDLTRFLKKLSFSWKRLGSGGGGNWGLECAIAIPVYFFHFKFVHFKTQDQNYKYTLYAAF